MAEACARLLPPPSKYPKLSAACLRTANLPAARLPDGRRRRGAKLATELAEIPLLRCLHRLTRCSGVATRWALAARGIFVVSIMPRHSAFAGLQPIFRIDDLALAIHPEALGDPLVAVHSDLARFQIDRLARVGAWPPVKAERARCGERYRSMPRERSVRKSAPPRRRRSSRRPRCGACCRHCRSRSRPRRSRRW